MLLKNWKFTLIMLVGWMISPVAHHSASGGNDCYATIHGHWKCLNNWANRFTSGATAVGDYRIPCRHCGQTDCIGCWGLRGRRQECCQRCANTVNTLHAHSAHFQTALASVFGHSLNCETFTHHRGIYAVHPNYYDARDTRVYSVQGYGVPIAVPLAPVVKYQYNYGWGSPASRLTPVNTEYSRYLSSQRPGGSGMPGMAAAAGTAQPPIVYAPTDTTQFGFYGLHAASWQPVPRTPWGSIGGDVIIYSPVQQARPVAIPQPNEPQPSGGVNVPAPTN